MYFRDIIFQTDCFDLRTCINGKIDRNTLAEWQKEGTDRILYLLDVRLPVEFEAGHLKGSLNAPGVQLIQATDEHMAVRNARVVLVDDTEIRAIMTASWLIQLGWRDVSVLEDGVGVGPLAQGPHKPRIPGLKKMKTVSVQALKESPEGRSLIVTEISGGEIFWGISFFIPDAPMPVALVAKTNTRLYLWSFEGLKQIIFNNGCMSWELVRLMIQKMQFASDMLNEFAFQPTTGRLAKVLLDHYGDTAGEINQKAMNYI